MQTTHNLIDWRHIGLVAVWLVSLGLGTGCNGDRPETAPVSGIVEYDGQPISGFERGAVTFTPRGGPMAKGTIDPSDGSFRLTTYRDGDGALIGPARVAVSATVDDPRATADDKYPGVRWVIPEKFADRDQSGLTCEVVADEQNVFRIKLSSNGDGTVEVE